MGRSIRPDLARHLAMHQCQICLFNLTACELRRQAPVRRVVLRDQQHAAGKPVEAMHDPWTHRAAHFRKRREAVKQRVDYRARVNARSRVDDHPRRFVDGHDVRIFVEHVQRNVFGRSA